MPNSISGSGLTTATQAELVAQLTAALQAIYGPDINLSSDSPDGQLMNIFIQAILDNLDLLTQVYNGMDPDHAFGVVLDSRVAYNGIQRQGGTFTLTNVSITTTKALTLQGLDTFPNDPYTVSDNAGTQWQLMATTNIAVAGTYVLAFQAALPGATLTTPNTITTPVTIVLGVTTINNPTTYTSLGINEETDAQLKIRRQRSVSLAGQGFLSNLLATLLNINGMVSAFVYENNTGDTDADGTPGHTIWVITSGTAPVADIANAIYRKRNAGAGMRGDVSYTITQVDGTPFIVYWDNVMAEDLYIKFTATSLDGINQPNIAAIRSGLVTLLVPGVNEQININDLATLVQQIDNNTLVTNAGFSTSPTGPFVAVISPGSKKKQFVVSEPNIIIVPMILNPVTWSMASGGATQQFTPLGGFGSYTYSIDSGPGSINGSGLFTSGIAGITVVRATDSQGNFATATVTAT